MKEEINWANKVRLAKIKKPNSTLLDELVEKEMISSYNHANQYVKLKGKQINVGKGVARIFGLSYEGIVPIGRENYNPIIATYFIKDEHEHYIPCLGYLIAKTNGKRKVAKLEALMEIMSFKQRNKFALGALISTMLVAEKEKVNWATWFPKVAK
jgi:hypothetical protein